MEKVSQTPKDHNEYFYGKKPEPVTSPAQEVLQHDFKQESLAEVQHDYRTLKQEQEKIKEVRQKLQNITQLETSFTIHKLTDEDRVVAEESEEEINAKFKEAEKILEDKNRFIKIIHTIERWLHLRA
jgi:hypothetical protein